MLLLADAHLELTEVEGPAAPFIPPFFLAERTKYPLLLLA
jgi:hypothetical protein